MNPVRFSLRYPQVAYTITVMLLVMGVRALLTMPRREDPKIDFPGGLVVALYPGATSEQVESQLTKRVEEHLFTYAELRKDKTRSYSRPGLMVVYLWTEDDVEDAQALWSKLQHGLNELHFTGLPTGVLGPVVDADFGDVTAILLAIQGERYSERELGRFAGRIEDDLRGIRAISKLRRIGEREEALYVTSSMERLSRYGVHPAQIIGSLQQQNAVTESGAVEVQQSRVALRTGGLYQAEEEIKHQIVGVSPISGQPIYVGDFANVERRYREDQGGVRVNGAPAVLIALEMREGNNIVEFGEEIEAELEHLREMLPPDLSISLVADQPRIVEERIGHFMRDFGLALVAVVLVTVLLLPIRVAAIAAFAIPVTISATFVLMQMFGIELHQVSLAGLIIVLGMVVDDAIVIADNYVELIGHGGLSPDEAAERSATGLWIPVLTATLILIMAFLPLAFLPGGPGAFISSLPVTIAIALGCSFFVAMLLTPLMCRALIKKETVGHEHEKGSKYSPLVVMQNVYDASINAAMKRRRLTLAGGLVAVLAGVAIMGQVEQQFFPSAERDQFVISLWLPSGTALATTDRVAQKVEAALAEDSLVVSNASFIGGGPPRFYYNFEPPFPAPNVAQILVNTTSVEATKEVVAHLQQTLPGLVPEAEVKVNQLQQGDTMESPIELRISGPDINTLKELGARMVEIFESTPGSRLVRTDYREEMYEVDVTVNNELASRLGMSNAGISQMLAGSFLGAPVSTYWEGTRSLPIVLRLDETARESYEDVRDLYIPSPMTAARVPLREVADLQPNWRPSNIVRRNGVRTMTVGTFTDDGLLPSVVLARLDEQVQSVDLPPGYSLQWGGEIENQTDTFGPMTVALMISLAVIFVIILLQFRKISEVMVVMATIPLSLFGAILGLLLTNNPFGFTAFLGLISLSGLVVRNAIILLDFIHERMHEGHGLEQSALEAGKRRLRPIFLTSVAGAVGVVPMIVSGSSLWAPLGSLIASGILVSMVLTLIVIPVLYVVVVEKRKPVPVVKAVPMPAPAQA